MAERKPVLLQPRVSFGGQREPGVLFLPVVLEGLAGQPVEPVRLTTRAAYELIGSLATALRELEQADRQRAASLARLHIVEDQPS